MFTIRFPRSRRKQDPSLTPTQHTLVEHKFEMLQCSSFGFTHDRLLHLQGEDLKVWTDTCTDELRRKITSVAPSHVKIALIEFRALRCVSLQCLPFSGPLMGLAYGRRRASDASPRLPMERTRPDGTAGCGPATGGARPGHAEARRSGSSAIHAP
jgi:hypothetical protein